MALAAPAWAQDKPDAAEFSQLVTNYAQSTLQEWITDPVIVYAIREQNTLFANLTERDIARMDKSWMDSGKFGPMVIDLLDRQASIIARERREEAGGVINEIIVMDMHGLNVAISDRTSDLFQGDEAKYQETYLKGPDAVHVSELKFDDSTQKVQTQVSLSVTDPETGEVIGAVTLGVSLDQLTN